MLEKPKQEEFPDLPQSSRVLRETARELEEKNKLKAKSPKDKLKEIAEELRKNENPNWENLKDQHSK